MRQRLEEISNQNIQAYFWPDVVTPLGRKTAITEGAIVAGVLAIIYGIELLMIYLNGAELPVELAEVVDTELFITIKMLLSGACFATAVAYIRSIGKKESMFSILFLLIWVCFELVSSYSSQSYFMIMVYGLLLVGSSNAYRGVRAPAI